MVNQKLFVLNSKKFDLCLGLKPKFRNYKESEFKFGYE